MQTKTKQNIFAKEESLRLSAELPGKDDNVIFALIFGSFSKGRQKANSDPDMAIFFKTPPGGNHPGLSESHHLIAGRFEFLVNKIISI